MNKEWISAAWVFLLVAAFWAGWIVACIFAAKQILKLRNQITMERQAGNNQKAEIIIDLRKK